MCLIENEVKPSSDTYYKVFGKDKQGNILWGIRGEKGDTDWFSTKLEEREFTSSDYGFCVWETKESAKEFIKMLMKVKHITNKLKDGKKLVIQKVKCREHIKSGMGKIDFKDCIITDNIEDCTLAQGFTFRYMKVI